MRDSDIAFDDEGTFAVHPGHSIQLEGYTFTITGRVPDIDNRQIFGSAYCPWFAKPMAVPA